MVLKIIQPSVTFGGKGKGAQAVVSAQGKGAQPPPEKEVYGEDGEELLWNAVTEAVAPILQYEREMDQNKLEKRIRDSFKKAAKSLPFHTKEWWELIDDYADACFSAIFGNFAEREWLPHCDFLLCLDAGIKDNFPKEALARVPKMEFEQTVLAAHDRAYEEQRVMPIMWEVVSSHMEGPKAKKKVYNAVEEAWKEARYAEDAQSFAGLFVGGTIERLAAVTNGEPQWTMEPKVAAKVFDLMLQAGAMPLSVVERFGPPPPRWHFIPQCVEQAYSNHIAIEEPVHHRGCKGGGKGFKGAAFNAFKGGRPTSHKERRPRGRNPLLADVPPGHCRDFLLNQCDRGDECKFAHDELVRQEVDLKRDLQDAENEDEAEAKRNRLE